MSAAGTAVTWWCTAERDRITKNITGAFRCFAPKAFIYVASGDWLLTRCEEQRDPPHAGLHELRVDALHVSGRQAVFIISITDGVNPG